MTYSTPPGVTPPAARLLCCRLSVGKGGCSKRAALRSGSITSTAPRSARRAVSSRVPLPPLAAAALFLLALLAPCPAAGMRPAASAADATAEMRAGLRAAPLHVRDAASTLTAQDITAHVPVTRHAVEVGAAPLACISTLELDPSFDTVGSVSEGRLFTFTDLNQTLFDVSAPAMSSSATYFTGTVTLSGKSVVAVLALSSSGAPAWAITLDSPSFAILVGQSVVVDLAGDGTVFVAATATNPSGVDPIAVIAALAPSGVVSWVRVIKDTNLPGSVLSPVALLPCPPSGHPRSDVVATATMGSASVIVRLAYDGSLVWATVAGYGSPPFLPQSPYGAIVRLTSLALDDTGAIVAAGACGSPQYLDITLYQNMLLLSLDSTGALLWASAWGGGNQALSINALHVWGNDSSIVVTGSLNTQVYVAQFSAGGSLLRAFVMNALRNAVSDYTIGQSLAGTSDGKLVLTGVVQRILAFGVTSTAFLLLLDLSNLSNEVAWGYAFSVSPYNVLSCSVAGNSDGSLVLAGQLASQNGLTGHGFHAVLDRWQPRLGLASDTVSLTQWGDSSLSTADVSLTVDTAATAQLSIGAAGASVTSSTMSLNGLALPLYAPLVVTWYTYSVDLAGLMPGGIPTALLMFPWAYALPVSSLFLTHLPSPPVAHPQVNGQGLDWVVFDSATNTLSGTPLSAPVDLSLAVPIVFPPVSDPIAGTFIFPALILHLCVQAVPSTFLSFVDMNAIATVTAGDGTIYAAAFSATSAGVLLLSAFSPDGTFLNVTNYIADLYSDSPALGLLPSGDLVVVSTHVVYGPGGDQEAFIGCFSPYGDLLWSKLVQGPDHVDTGARGAVVTPQGNIVFTGSVGGKLLLASMAPDGDLQWAQEVTSPDGSYTDGYDVASAGSDAPGNPSVIVVGGYGGVFAFVAAFDAQGALVWASVLAPNTPMNSAPLYSLFATSVDMNAEGDAAVAVQTGDTSGGPVVVARFRSDGSLDWAISLVIPSSPVCIKPGVAWLQDGSGSIGVGASCGVPLPNYPDGFITTSIMAASLTSYGANNWLKAIDLSQIWMPGVTVSALANGNVLLGTTGLLGSLTPTGEVLPPYGGGPHAVTYTNTALLAQAVVNKTAQFYVAPLMANVSSGSLGPDDAPLPYYRSGYVIPGALTPYIQVPFGLWYALQFSSFLLPGVSVSLVQGPGGAPLAPWLNYNLSQLNGYPTGSIRLLYPVTLTVSMARPPRLHILGSNIVTLTFCLNVTNTAPFYIGPSSLSTGLGTFGFRLEWDDAEGDAVSGFMLGRVGTEDPPSFLSVSPTLGTLTGTTVAGAGGVYAVNVTVSDTYGAVGWTLIHLHINEPSALAAAFAQYWPFLLSAFLLFCVITTLAWRDRTTQGADLLLYTVSTKLCRPQRCVGSPTALEVAEQREALQNMVLAQLDDALFDTNVLLRETEAFCVAVTAFAVKGQPERNFVGRLALSDFFLALLTFLDTRVVNRQLLELRESVEGQELTFPILFHRKTLLVIHVITRVMETALLCFAQQMPEPEPPGPLCAWLASAACKRRQRRDAGDALRYGVSSVVAREWLDALGVASGNVAGPLGLPSDSAPVEVQILHGLAYLRQSIVYLPDTNTSLDLLVSSLVKVLAPPDLLSDWMFIFSDVPVTWSSLLFEARMGCVGLVGLPPGPIRQRGLLQLQQWLHVATGGGKGGNADWRLLYGVTLLFGGLLQSSLTEGEHAQLCGPCAGALTLTTLTQWRGRGNAAKWVRAAARWLSGPLPDYDTPLTRATLHTFPLVPNAAVVASVERESSFEHDTPSKGGLVMVAGWATPV